MPTAAQQAGLALLEGTPVWKPLLSSRYTRCWEYLFSVLFMHLSHSHVCRDSCIFVMRAVNRKLVLHTCLRVQRVRMCCAICTARKCVSFRHTGMETSCQMTSIFGYIQQVMLCIYSTTLHSIVYIGQEYVIIQKSRG